MDIDRFWKKIDQGMDKIKLLDKPLPLERLFGEEKVKIGLDIGTYSVKMVQLKDTSTGPTLVKLGYKEIPKTSGSEVDSIAGVLGELWQEQKIKARKVKLTVSDPSIYLRHISIPRVTEEELVKAIKWQAEKYIPFSIGDAIVDFQTLGPNSKEGSGQMEIIIVAAKKETINKYLTILKRARLIPTNLDVCPFAVAKSFLKDYPVNKEEMVAIIDIGVKTVSCIITKGGSLLFVRNIGLSGSDFTQGTLLVELAKEIDRSFAYCEKEFLNQGINRVILCGGGARFKGLDKFLKDRLGVQVEAGNPFKNIAVGQIGVDTSILEDVSSSLMAAVGAAL